MRQKKQKQSKYGKRIKKHLSYQSNMRKELYSKIPSEILDKMLNALFSEIIDIYDNIFILDLPYITFSIEGTNRLKGNINRIYLNRQSSAKYIPFTVLKRCISTRKNTYKQDNKKININPPGGTEKTYK